MLFSTTGGSNLQVKNQDLRWATLTIGVLDRDGLGHDGVAHTILVLSADSELVLMSFDEFLH